MTIGVLDDRGLLKLFRAVEGRRLLGALDCFDAIELVFSEHAEQPNLITLYVDGRDAGLVDLGFVSDASRYVRVWRAFERAA